jgi:hypothetical protein
MPKENAEFNDLKTNSAVADLTGRRHGRVVVVVGKGLFRIRFDDGGEELLGREQILSRYTTESRSFIPAAFKP